MEVRMASYAAPDRSENEDHGFVAAGFLGVLDGVTESSDGGNGCIHGTAWYVRHLAAHLAQVNASSPGSSLPRVLAGAIMATRADHGGYCQLDEPNTPAATVCLLRQRGSEIDYLVLCDTTLVLEHDGQIDVITDLRFRDTIARLRDVSPASVTTIRNRQITTAKWEHVNRDGGYWIAGSNPNAAYQALTGTLSCVGEAGVRRAALLTDGASSAVETFALLDWRGLLDLLTREGPSALIDRIRVAEGSPLNASDAIKRYDDATAAICLFPGSAQ